MSILIPAIVCLFVKLYLLIASSRTAENRRTLFFLLLFFFAFNNLAEILMRSVFILGHSPKFWFKVYYVSIIAVLTTLLIYTFNVSRIGNKNKLLKIIIVIFSSVLCGIIIFSDQMVTGYTIMNSLSNAERGERYWVFKVMTYFLLGTTLILLLIGYFRSTEHIQQNQCLYLLAAVLPLCIIGFILMFMISRGFPNSGLLLIPIASTFFSFVLLKTEAKHQLTDLRRYVPFSLERDTSHSIQETIAKYSMEDINHKQAMNEIERSLVKYKNIKTDNNISHAAKSMDVPRSTLYAILKRLNMNAD